MNNSAILSPLLDPVCFLPPELASQAMIARYISVGTLGAFIWEILNNILNDYKLLSKHRISLPTAIYFISRVTTLGSIIATTVFESRAVNSCHWFEKAQDIVFSASVISTSLLFFIRTRAIFDRNPWVVAFFASLWLAVAAGSMTAMAGIDATYSAPTKYCINAKIEPFSTAATIIPLINDTLVFLAITWRLSCNSCAQDTLKNGIRALVFGDHLPVLSKAMLQDGQAYYLTTITMNIITVIMLCDRSATDNLRTVFAIPNITLMNIMACRVFRNTKLGFFRERELSTSFISKDLDFARSAIIPLSHREVETGGRTRQLEGIPNLHSIAVIQTVERT